MRLRAGEVAGFRRKRSGNASRTRYFLKETCSIQGSCIQQGPAVSALSNFLATAGSGRPAPTPGTPVTSHFLARSANTTASLCAVRWFYVEGPASRLPVMCVRPIAISFNRPRGGSSAEYVWQLERVIVHDNLLSCVRFGAPASLTTQSRYSQKYKPQAREAVST